ncbi:DUF6913 domain-containing protein [Aequorivita viscosa]|uniref:Uncharacterized protein n=1 Tax=Aequorivita viscosa TaxID=797419 RepID=A0A1M6IVC0_9FLAO|nr:hypothetical protein [Aequorivita viscosa]SDX14529.1 hypothetical protein SAMN05216556_11852 [Aequorivita viscosa]SHJ38269.1 hypothetical protein SAMN04487908_11551 [Aequorivita viscosa]
MLKKFKLYFLKKQTDKNLLQRDVSQRNTSLKYMGFLIDETFFNDFEKLFKFGTELGLQRKDIKQFTFLETKKKVPSLRENQISNKEFNWKGEIQNEEAKEFLNFPFDAIIGLYKGKHDYLDAMMAQSKAKFKIGFNNADDRLYDLLLTIDLKNPETFKSEVGKYLKILKKI